MGILNLALKSVRYRKFTVSLTVLSIALSVMLLLGIEKIRANAKASFTSAVSGTDLIVGSRTSPSQLLLFSIFHIGYPNQSVSWESYEKLHDHPLLEWTIPLSLGDSHKGFRVIGTNDNFIRHYQYAQNQFLTFEKGQWLQGGYDAVIGAEVAKKLGYLLNDSIVIAHGTGKESFMLHDDKPFVIKGILKRTGTSVDRGIYLSLKSIGSLHEQLNSKEHDHDPLMLRNKHEDEAEDASLSAILVGLKSPVTTLAMQRYFNDFDSEPLTAILPGVVLLELWSILDTFESILIMVSMMVMVVSLSGMLIIMTTSLNERRREMAILRSIGARPVHISLLIMTEAVVITSVALVLGVCLSYSAMYFLAPWMTASFGLNLTFGWPQKTELIWLTAVACCGLMVGTIPAIRVYYYALTDGLTVKV